MEKLSYHVVFTTHNSRTSQRMIKYKVLKGPPVNLILEEEIRLTEILKSIVLEYHIEILSFNICKDHVHLLLSCTDEEVPVFARILKSISSKKFSFGKTLWSQKFYGVCCDTFDFITWTRFNCLSWNTSYFTNTVAYIQNNRNKHSLVDDRGLAELINSFCVIQRVDYFHDKGSRPLGG